MKTYLRNTWALTLGQYTIRQRRTLVAADSSREREAV